MKSNGSSISKCKEVEIRDMPWWSGGANPVRLSEPWRSSCPVEHQHHHDDANMPVVRKENEHLHDLEVSLAIIEGGTRFFSEVRIAFFRCSIFPQSRCLDQITEEALRKLYIPGVSTNREYSYT